MRVKPRRIHDDPTQPCDPILGRLHIAALRSSTDNHLFASERSAGRNSAHYPHTLRQSSRPTDIPAQNEQHHEGLMSESFRFARQSKADRILIGSTARDPDPVPKQRGEAVIHSRCRHYPGGADPVWRESNLTGTFEVRLQANLGRYDQWRIERHRARPPARRLVDEGNRQAGETPPARLREPRRPHCRPVIEAARPLGPGCQRL